MQISKDLKVLIWIVRCVRKKLKLFLNTCTKVLSSVLKKQNKKIKLYTICKQACIHNKMFSVLIHAREV